MANKSREDILYRLLAKYIIKVPSCLVLGKEECTQKLKRHANRLPYM